MAVCGNSAMLTTWWKMAKKKSSTRIYLRIDNFKVRYAHVPQLSYVAIDSRDMSAFQDCSFDAVIDKGLADAMLCGVDPAEGVLHMLRETYLACRILRPQGVFMLITYSHPEIRMPALQEPGLKWSILLYALAKQSRNGNH
ncbi:EEF1A lysine methyltransferase 4-like [Selaginella moellendorffii]|uniref:EEF1A lysine methyltransferase 4-like n=1 Tax=Selaginella moellendorffii TaxID=88036 RepID=UPI000D1CF504|nr:EEF1A lysine methyltransferase 4-like [Selaginella moellendorffii]XP_024525132.1 EEF1A lysine methyltransferase 4-like [Selaginella moellendorffii]|eukprot:XP_024524496.1 EEF1A lysine methyltransferase 4-like [Selaginella moellendorffii]